MTPLDSIALVGRILNMREAGYGVDAMIDVVEEFERVAARRGLEAERKACAALVYEYGDVSAYEAILRRDKGPHFRDEEKRR